MKAKQTIAIVAWMPEAMRARLASEFPEYEFRDALQPADLDEHLQSASIVYGLPPLSRLQAAKNLRWIQLTSAGVPQELCPEASRQQLEITCLSGLYGPSIAEHALGMMLMLARNLHVVIRQQQAQQWNRELAKSMADLHGRTLAVVGVGNIGQHIARLARALGMRVLGCRRRDRPTPDVDRWYPRSELHEMLADADHVAVAAPLTAATDGMLGSREFSALKSGAFYINVSRGAVAQEAALLAALRSGRLAGAGLDAYAMEPLPADHPFWTMPQVIVSPHYSGETINNSSLPAERFLRNLRSWRDQKPREGVVDLEHGY